MNLHTCTSACTHIEPHWQQAVKDVLLISAGMATPEIGINEPVRVIK